MKLYSLLLLPLILGSACNKKSAQSGVSPAPVTADVKSPEGMPALPSTPNAPDIRPVAATLAPERFECDALDYGLFWFGLGDVAQKVTASTRSSFYDKNKPTVIYVHGWQSGSHVTKKRSTFNYSKVDPFNGPKVDGADAWIRAGWNVGVFYWNQFADEKSVVKAEDKIWNDTPLTWQNCDGKAVTTDVPAGNASDLLFKAYAEALKDYQGPHIRLAGHSLGNQMVTRLASRAFEAAKSGTIDAHLVPKRVALLDPFWSAGSSSTASRGASVRSLIAPLKSSGMIFEWYKTSTLSDSDQGDANLELRSMIGQTEIEPDFYSAKNSVSRHGAAPYLYFLSFASPAPSGCKSPCTDVAPSAATSDARMLELMNKGSLWEQVTGMATVETSDNTFQLKTK